MARSRVRTWKPDIRNDPLYPAVVTAMSQRRSECFYNCIDVLLCYELARDVGKIVSYRGDLGLGVVIRRFESKPRYRIFHVSGPLSGALELAERLAFESYRPVRIDNLTEADGLELHRLNPQGILLIEEEAIITPVDICGGPAEFFSTRELGMLRRDERELKYSCSLGPLEGQSQVLDLWKQHNGEKHFRLSISRDYKACDPQGLTVSSFHFLGKRESLPVCTHVISNHTSTPGLGVQLVEKSLNYRVLAGGRPGTSNANLVMMCDYFVQQPLGVQEINIGSFGGGNAGLGDRKRRLASRMIKGAQFTTSFPHKTG